MAASSASTPPAVAATTTMLEEEEEEVSEATAITPVLDDGGSDGGGKGGGGDGCGGEGGGGDGGDGGGDGGGGGQAESRLVSEVTYDVPTEPTLTRGPHNPALLFTALDHHHSPHQLSDTWTRISQLRGNACQRVRCSHKSVIPVSKPSSVGRIPSRLLPHTRLDHNHSPHLSATHGHEYLN